MKKIAVVSCLALLVLAAGCGSSSDSGGGGSSGSSSGGSGTATDANAVCGAIPKPDVQALFTSTVSGDTFNKIGANFQCKYELTDSKGTKNNDTHATLYVSDANEKQYGLLKTQFPGDTFYDLSGVGDKAYWFQAIDGLGVPAVVVHKGDASCVVQVADALENTTCTYTSTQSVSQADGEAYALKMGKLCDDLFGGT